MDPNDIIRWFSAGAGGLGLLSGALTCVLVPGCAIAILAIFGVALYRRSRQANAALQSAQQWHSTTGTVLMSQVAVQRTGRSRHVYPRIVYQYVVNGQAYTGQRIRAGDQFLRVRITGQLEQTIARYAVGATVTVYYNPTNPAESALER